MLGFRSFCKDESGNFAILFALSMVPLFGIVGAAIDYSRASEVRAKLSEALDAGVLAVGSQPKMSDDKAFEIVNDWVSAHLGTEYDGYWHLNSVKVGDDGTILASASGDIDTTMGRLLGLDEIEIGTTSEAIRSMGKVEVALVLDNTGSMRGRKLEKLKEAAHALVDELVKATDDPKDLRISLVPFSQTVNVGAANKDAAWIDSGGRSSIHDDIFTHDDGTVHAGTKRFDLFDKMEVDWAGCVESRPAPYDVEEAPPSAANAETLYVPYFAPDEPDDTYKDDGNRKDVYNNNYLKDDKADKKWLGQQGNPAKYTTFTQPAELTDDLSYKKGPNSGCELQEIIRLTDDVSEDAVKEIGDAIDDMVAIGNTHINIGLQWGWHALSPNAPFADGVAYDDGEWRKVVVLMTDGNNQNTDNGNDDNKNNSVYSGYGYIWQNRFGNYGATSPSQSTRTAALDGRLALLCENMKKDEITLYTVRVEVRDGSSSVLKNCASSAENFKEVADISQLKTEFMEIAGSIQALRLSK
jgi:hypothetical protein